MPCTAHESCTSYSNKNCAHRSYATGIKLTELKDKLGRIGIKHIVVHFDCCHAGGIFLDTRDTTRQFVLERWGGAPIVQGVTAVTADETAIERNGNGLFTRTLCEQLEGGDIFEMHRQEYVTGDQLFSRVTTLVMEEAQKQRHAMTPMHKPILAKHGGEQCYGEMLFVRPRAASPAGSAASESAAERV